MGTLQEELEKLNSEIEAEDQALLSGGTEEEPVEEKTEEAAPEPVEEKPDAEKVEEEIVETPAPEVVEEKKPEVEATAVNVPDVKTTLTESPADASHARLRWEASEARREATELKRKLAEKEAPPVAKKEENYEAYIENEIGLSKKEIQELKEWKAEQQRESVMNSTLDQATNEFIQYEKQFRIQNSNVTDYEDASRHAVGTIYNSIKTLNPELPDNELMKATKLELLKRASKALNSGENPAGYLYKQAYSEFGYRPKPKSTEVVEKPTASRSPSITKIAENKKRSANMAGSGGSGTPSVGNEALSTMTNAELAKLTPSDWERMERESA